MRSVTNLTLILALILLSAQGVCAQSPQPAARVYDEARTVYLGNLARRQNGLPPLRWNWQLTAAARWFSWDSVENRPEPYCGHQDTLGGWPDWRARHFGYKGAAGAENAFCGYVSPEQGIEGWLVSPDHRANLLDPNSREIGLGYYLREGDGRGYVTQDFGHDRAYAPLVIEDEALNTTSPRVNLYIYDSAPSLSFAGMGAIQEMMVANDPCFSGAVWEPYRAEKPWTLEPGEGWRSVYVKTRDRLGRTAVVSDSIYLGATVPLDELGPAQMSSTQEQVTLYALDGGGLPPLEASGSLPLVQFSLGWLADDTFATFGLQWGNGERVNDAQAWGGSAFRLRPGAGESYAWVWTTDFVRNLPLVAYFRLKVSDNSSPTEVGRISIKGGSTDYGPLSLKGSDFPLADAYQEFPLAFTFSPTPDDPFLIFNFWRSGEAELYVDAVTIYTAPQPVEASLAWQVPGGNYRGQGIWVRYTDGSARFSPRAEGITRPSGLAASPGSVLMLAERQGRPAPYLLSVHRLGCQLFTWRARSEANWLHLEAAGDTLWLTADATGLGAGAYQGSVTIEAEGLAGVAPVSVAVTLIVAEELSHAFLPLILSP